MIKRAVGIDLGATHLHVAVLDGDDLLVFTTTELADVVDTCVGAHRIAIDAPSEPATGRVHAGTHSPKFAVARCNEIASGEQLGVWVPWVTPTFDACPRWMRTGLTVWSALRAEGHEPIEVYPAGCFWLLNGRRWPPKKSTREGRATRRALLPLDTEVDSHDHLDAVMAAVVARGPSIAITHTDPGCDSSAIWFPDLSPYQCSVPGSPLNGPSISEVTQPP